MEQLKEMIMKGKAKETVEQVKKLLDQGKDPGVLLKEAMIPAMDEVGDLFQRGEYFVLRNLALLRDHHINGRDWSAHLAWQGKKHLLGYGDRMVGTRSGHSVYCDLRYAAARIAGIFPGAILVP